MHNTCYALSTCDAEDSSSSGTSRSAKHRQRQNSKKQPPPPASPNVLFVPNMKQGTTEEQLAEHFRCVTKICVIEHFVFVFLSANTTGVLAVLAAALSAPNVAGPRAFPPACWTVLGRELHCKPPYKAETFLHCREQPGYETAQLRQFGGRRNDGYVTFASAEAAAAALEVCYHVGCSRVQHGLSAMPQVFKQADASQLL